MSLPQEFWERLPEKTDAQLYDMLAHPSDYLPEALGAAREELGKRNLPQETGAQLEAAAQEKKQVEDAKAAEPLSGPMRVLVFLFCTGLVGVILAVYYNSNGYDRKASDCWSTMGLSLLAHVLLAVLLALIS